jgi:UDP-N-acetylmuramate dehydrogenase
MQIPAIKENVSLLPLTAFKIGGKARYFTEVKNSDELKEALRFAKEEGLPFFVLGGGSNVLIGDAGFDGLVLKMEMRGKSWEEKGDEVFVKAAAGENWDALISEAVGKGFFGFENLSAIPGSVGGSVVQNIGAYGAEIKDVVKEVEVLDTEKGEVKTLNNEECEFAYRTSIFKKKDKRNLVILSVTYRLSKNGKLNISYRDLDLYFKNKPDVQESLQNVRNAVVEIRGGKFPPLDQYGTAGSFFKNPIVEKKLYEELKLKYPNIPGFPAGVDQIKIPAAWLLDKVGNFKGVREDDVGSWQNQALVLVNYDKAAASDVKALAARMQKVIKDHTGISLEPEVQFVGE